MNTKPLPGVNDPDPNRCHWCNGELAIIHYHYDPPYNVVVGYSDRYDCHCINEQCDAFMATGAVTTYPQTAQRVVDSRKKKRGSNKPVIDSYALSYFQIDQDAPVTTLDIERARAAIGQGGNS